MKKAILLILALAMLCTAVCACTDGGNVNDNHGGVVTDTPMTAISATISRTQQTMSAMR